MRAPALRDLRAMVLATLVAGLASVLGAEDACAKGEQYGRLSFPREGVPAEDAPAITVSVLAGPASRHGGGWGFFRVDLDNEDDRPHDVVVEVRSRFGPSEGRPATAARKVAVGAKERRRTWIPSPPGETNTVFCRAGDAEPVTAWPSDSAAVLQVALLASGERTGPNLQAAVAARTGSGRYPDSALGIVPMEVDDLPPTWAWLTGCAAVVLDAGRPGLEEASRQQVLLDYVEGGGFLLLLHEGALPKGPLADALGPVRANGRRGLGAWTALSQQQLGATDAEDAVALWLRRRTATPMDAANDVAALPLALREHADIPGLGRVPVRAFFFLLLAFAVVVGPVTYAVLRRRKRLTMLTVVVPAIGLGFAGAILAYGLLSEGFGTRGAVRSFTWLDQRSHHAVCLASRTLYAGWGPAALTPSPDTVVGGDGDEGPARFGRWRPTDVEADLRLDVDASRLDGSLVPSRTLTTLVTSSRARSRERIRFRRAVGGTYEVVASDTFTADLSAGPILLRDAAGAYHVLRREGKPSQSLDEIAAAGLVGEAFAGWSHRIPPPDDEDPVYGLYRSSYGASGPDVRSDTALREWLSARFEPGLPPGSFLAWTRRAPAFDDLGLEVDWKGEKHLVLGLLGPDDVIEEPR